MSPLPRSDAARTGPQAGAGARPGRAHSQKSGLPHRTQAFSPAAPSIHRSPE